MRSNPPLGRVVLLLLFISLPGLGSFAAAQPPEPAQARQVLLDALQVHGGAGALARSRALEISGVMRNRGRGGLFSELPFTAVLGQRGAMRAELQTPSGETRLVVSDGQRMTRWILMQRY